jgi:hypothetical protein
MIDTVTNSPDDMRQAVYDLARYKLQEQFTHADVKDIKRTLEALETAIRGVEAFSKQHVRVDLPAAQPLLEDRNTAPVSHRRPAQELLTPAPPRPPLRVVAEPDTNRSKPDRTPWPHLKRTALMIAIVIGALVLVQQRERLATLTQYLPKFDAPKAIEDKKTAAVQIPSEPASAPMPLPSPLSPKPLRPTDYGVYAVSNDALSELHALPGRALDARVAVSAAFAVPSQTILPDGHPKFIVFRRDVASNIADRAEVRIVAKIAREFSADAAGKKPGEGDAWVVRNISFPFRASPVSDNPEMYELHSEDPALELTPGRYALVIKNQSYEFSIQGQIVDPRQCIERIATSNGTFFSECKKP